MSDRRRVYSLEDIAQVAGMAVSLLLSPCAGAYGRIGRTQMMELISYHVLYGQGFSTALAQTLALIMAVTCDCWSVIGAQGRGLMGLSVHSLLGVCMIYVHAYVMEVWKHFRHAP